MEKSQIKSKANNPVGILALVFIYYFLKFVMESAASGVSMAVVEGVSSGASGWGVSKKAMLISPVFAYLAFAIVYIVSEPLRLSKRRVAKAVDYTFLFHIVFFIVSLAAFFLSGPQTFCMFEETAVGGLVMAIGNWLPLLLVGFFVWRYAVATEQPRVEDPMASAFKNTQSV